MNISTAQLKTNIPLELSIKLDELAKEKNMSVSETLEAIIWAVYTDDKIKKIQDDNE